MAMVKTIRHEPNAGGRPRSVVDCGYSILEVDGRTVLHLETYGSSEREIPGKVSQSLEFGVESAAELLKAIRTAFPALR